jgi:hypothetical protein
MRNLFLVLVLIVLIGCSSSQNQKATLDTIISTKSKYNPKVDHEYFYPKQEQEILSDTISGEYVIKTSIYPIKDKYVVIYSEFLDTTSMKDVTDKIKYRDYFLKINIKSSNGSVVIDKSVNKFDFATILKQDLKDYFIRVVKFVNFKNNEFRFDIKISYLDCSVDNFFMVEYYISLKNVVRFKNYPDSFYDALYHDLVDNDK